MRISKKINVKFLASSGYLYSFKSLLNFYVICPKEICDLF